MTEARELSRRRALQAAGAAGLAATAWSAPSIAGFGTAPAYGQGGSGQVQNELRDVQPLNANCASAECGGEPEWGSAAGDTGRISFGGGDFVEFTVIAGPSGTTCLSNADNTVVLTDVPTGWTCNIVRVDISCGNGGGPNNVNVAGPGGPTVPVCVGDSICDSFVYPIVECTTT